MPQGYSWKEELFNILNLTPTKEIVDTWQKESLDIQKKKKKKKNKAKK